MATPVQLPTRGHFVNGNGWLGSAGPLRYQIETPVEIPTDPPAQDPEDKDYTMDVVWWQGPFSRPYAQEIGRQTFPVTTEGLADLTAFLDAKAAEMETNPVFTEEETFQFYREKKAEEDAPKD